MLTSTWPIARSCLTCRNVPIGLGLTVPKTPASSNASCAAASARLLPGIGQPLGIDHRLERRPVTSRTSIPLFAVNRQGSAPVWIGDLTLGSRVIEEL